jgi:hypothetical protein
MQNTGDGTRTSVRDLAEHAGCHPSHIGELLTGEQETASYEHAVGVCRRLGVDLLVLWTPVERADAAIRNSRPLQKVAG